MHSTVLRVQPLYEKSGPRKHSVKQAAEHNARKGGDLEHIDKSRTHLNEVLLGYCDIEKDVEDALKQYPRASKNGPVAGEIMMTANKEFFENLSEHERRKWAIHSLEWALNEFDNKGSGKVVSCHWHRDEEAEHLHITVVPIADCVVGNQHSKKTVRKINYAAVLGKPRGGEKDLPPSERRWGKKQTSYAEHMAAWGHSLVRGVKNRQNRKHKSPSTYRAELAKNLKTTTDDLVNAPQGSLVPKEKALAAAKAHCKTWQENAQRILNSAKNRVEVLEQILEDVAKTIGCPSSAELPQYAKELAHGLEYMAIKPQNVVAKGKQLLREEAEQELLASTHTLQSLPPNDTPKPPRTVKGQRKTPEERRLARLARKKHAEQEQKLNSINHNITFLSKEIYHAKFTKFIGTGQVNHIQNPSSMPLQPDKQHYVPAQYNMGY